MLAPAAMRDGTGPFTSAPDAIHYVGIAPGADDHQPAVFDSETGCELAAKEIGNDVSLLLGGDFSIWAHSVSRGRATIGAAWDCTLTGKLIQAHPERAEGRLVASILGYVTPGSGWMRLVRGAAGCAMISERV